MLLPPPSKPYKLKVVKSFIKNIGIRVKYFIEESVKKYIHKTLKKVIIMSISGSFVMQSLILSPIFMGALTKQSKAMMDGDGSYSWMDNFGDNFGNKFNNGGVVDSLNNYGASVVEIESCTSLSVSTSFFEKNCKKVGEVNNNIANASNEVITGAVMCTAPSFEVFLDSYDLYEVKFEYDDLIQYSNDDFSFEDTSFWWLFWDKDKKDKSKDSNNGRTNRVVAVAVKVAVRSTITNVLTGGGFFRVTPLNPNQDKYLNEMRSKWESEKRGYVGC
jgi:hypothetical protein